MLVFAFFGGIDAAAFGGDDGRFELRSSGISMPSRFSSSSSGFDPFRWRW